jgi:hypothetical protein
VQQSIPKALHSLGLERWSKQPRVAPRRGSLRSTFTLSMSAMRCTRPSVLIVPRLSSWLLCVSANASRCFGDKGDVEDITEGSWHKSALVSPHGIQCGVSIADYRLADIISTVEFDQTGNYLATGDKGGRVVLFERNETVHVFPPSTRTLRLTRSRKKPASTSFTPSSNRTSPSSTT